MSVIWKYDIPVLDSFEIDIPPGARILTVAMQDSTPRIWVQCNSTGHRVRVKFWIVGTGNPHHGLEQHYYVGSWQDGPFVWHLFTRSQITTGE